MQDGTWGNIAGIAGQRITDCLPSPIPNFGTNNPVGITRAWCGAAVDQRRGELILAGNGGHADYPGNEGYALSLRATTPAWRRLSDPTPNGSFGVSTENDGLFADGRPRAMHNTFECFGDGRVWMTVMNSVASDSGGTVNRIVSYNRDMLGAAASPLAYTSANLGPWALHGRIWPAGTDMSGIKFGISCFDRKRHKVWSFAGEGANYTVYWNVSTFGSTLGTTQLYGDGLSFGSWRWAVCAYDLDIIIVADYTQQSFQVLDLKNPGHGASSWQVPSNISGSGYWGWGINDAPAAQYVQKNRCIAIIDPLNLGKTIYKLAIPTTVTGGRTVYNPSGTWVWSQLNPSGPAIDTDSAGNRSTYGKGNIIEDMGDGRSALVYVGNIAGATSVYKIPAAGL